MARSRDLTPRQRGIYEFIRDRIRTRGYGPTVREIGDQFGIHSPNGVVSHLRALQKKGMIARHRGRARAIQLTREGPMALLQVGTVTAGEPLALAEAPSRRDFGPLFQGKDTVVLEVAGRAAPDEALLAGDCLLVDRDRSARSGQVVVATLADGTAAVGRFRHEKDRVHIDPIGTRGRSLVATRSKVFGVVRGLIRTFP